MRCRHPAGCARRQLGDPRRGHCSSLRHPRDPTRTVRSRRRMRLSRLHRRRRRMRCPPRDPLVAGRSHLTAQPRPRLPPPSRAHRTLPHRRRPHQPLAGWLPPTNAQAGPDQASQTACRATSPTRLPPTQATHGTPGTPATTLLMGTHRMLTSPDQGTLPGATRRSGEISAQAPRRVRERCGRGTGARACHHPGRRR